MIAFPETTRIHPEPTRPHREHYLVREADFLAAVELHSLVLNWWSVRYALPQWNFFMLYERLANGTVAVYTDLQYRGLDMGERETVEAIWGNIALPQKRFLGTEWDAAQEVTRALNDWAQVQVIVFNRKAETRKVLKSFTWMGPNIKLNFYEGWHQTAGHVMRAANPFAAMMDYLSEE